MTYKDFLQKIPMHRARTEYKFDLRVYVNPKGNGFLFGLDGTGKTLGRGQEMVKIPYSNRQTALQMFEDLLRQAEAFAQRTPAYAAARPE